MGRKVLILALLALAALVSLSPASAQVVPVMVTMNAENASGQSGTATLMPLGVATLVDINITPGAAGVPQPAHIHTGQCPDVGFVIHALSDVVNGRSSTMVAAPIGDVANGTLAINVHKSALEIGIFTSCGNIPTG